MVRVSVLQSVDLGLFSLSNHTKDFKSGIYNSMLGDQPERDTGEIRL